MHEFCFGFRVLGLAYWGLGWAPDVLGAGLRFTGVLFHGLDFSGLAYFLDALLPHRVGPVCRGDHGN